MVKNKHEKKESDFKALLAGDEHDAEKSGV